MEEFQNNYAQWKKATLTPEKVHSVISIYVEFQKMKTHLSWQEADPAVACVTLQCKSGETLGQNYQR